MTRRNKRLIDISLKDISLLEELSRGDTMSKRTHAIMCDLFLVSDFKTFVKKMRQKLKIPPQGYSRNKLILMNATAYWLGSSRDVKDGKRLHIVAIDIADFISRHPYLKTVSRDGYLGRTYSLAIKDYIIFGDVETSPMIDIRHSKTDELEGGVSITFSPHMGKRELIRQINNDYPIIQEVARAARSLKERKEKIKPVQEFERDVYIYNEFQNPELKKMMTDLNSEYPQMVVAKLTNKYFGYIAKPMKADAVRKAYDRTKKRVDEVNSIDT